MTGASLIVANLAEQLWKCLVLISGRDRGSGFFIAPNTIVTCAHVAGGPGAEVKVSWQGQELPGVVKWGSQPGPVGELTPYPDIAVVEVEMPEGGHQSVLLDDHRPTTATEFTAVGFAAVYTTSPAPNSGQFRRRGEYAEMIRLTDDVIEPGMSGGPVLNEETGGVCGVTKASRQPGEPAGGVAVPIRALRRVMPAEDYRDLRRRHDAYHRRNRVWLRCADALPAAEGAIAGYAERALQPLLVRLPPLSADEHLADYRAVVRDPGAEVPNPLHEHGDVVAELAGLAPPADGLPYVLDYALRLARAAEPPFADELGRWALLAAPTSGNRELVQAGLSAARGRDPEPVARLSSVLVHVWPLGSNRRRYRCELWRHDDEGWTSLDTEGTDRSADELRAHLRETLPKLVRRGGAGGKPPMIELVLPMDLLDEEVERWPGRRIYSLLGLSNPVVVRGLERFELNPAEEDDEELLAIWKERWDTLGGRRIGTGEAPLMFVGCTEQRDKTALFAQLELDPGLGGVVLPDTPRRQTRLRTVLDVGIDNGISIVVWRRNGCGGEPGVAHDSCAGARLGEAITSALAGVRRDDVPEKILQLRKQAAAQGDPECGNDVVLFWDAPDRRPERPLMTPPKGSTGG